MLPRFDLLPLLLLILMLTRGWRCYCCYCWFCWISNKKNLLEINISWCDSITENGIEALARGCTKLRRFSSKGCKQVNNNAVICLATYCKSLTVLNLHSCDVSTREFLFTGHTLLNQISYVLFIPFTILNKKPNLIICFDMGRVVTSTHILMREGWANRITPLKFNELFWKFFKIIWSCQGFLSEKDSKYHSQLQSLWPSNFNEFSKLPPPPQFIDFNRLFV